MMTSDPWGMIEPPAAADAISGLRVDPSVTWDFFWARDLDRRRLLVLFFSSDLHVGRLPHPAGLEVTVRNSSGRSMLVLALLDSAHKDIFYQLCSDIVSSASAAESEEAALAIAVARTWRWHHLLRGGGDTRLSKEEQKGLVGELLVLDRYLLSVLPVRDAIASWVGPLGAPKDFELGSVCIEAKARRGTAAPFVAVSSEFQLDRHGCDVVFLHVVDLANAASGATEAYTVHQLSQQVAGRITLLDLGSMEQYESLLAAAGFRWEDDYSDCLWTETSSALYCVSEDFPRLSASDIPLGVSAVKYSLALSACAPYEVQAEQLFEALGKESNVE